MTHYVRAHRIPGVAFAKFNVCAEATALGLPYVPAGRANRDYSGCLAISRTAMVDGRCAGGAN